MNCKQGMKACNSHNDEHGMAIKEIVTVAGSHNDEHGMTKKEIDVSFNSQVVATALGFLPRKLPSKDITWFYASTSSWYILRLIELIAKKTPAAKKIRNLPKALGNSNRSEKEEKAIPQGTIWICFHSIHPPFRTDEPEIAISSFFPFQLFGIGARRTHSAVITPSSSPSGFRQIKLFRSVFSPFYLPLIPSGLFSFRGRITPGESDGAGQAKNYTRGTQAWCSERNSWSVPNSIV